MFLPSLNLVNFKVKLKFKLSLNSYYIPTKSSFPKFNFDQDCKEFEVTNTNCKYTALP